MEIRHPSGADLLHDFLWYLVTNYDLRLLLVHCPQAPRWPFRTFLRTIQAIYMAMMIGSERVFLFI